MENILISVSKIFKQYPTRIIVYSILFTIAFNSYAYFDEISIINRAVNVSFGSILIYFFLSSMSIVPFFYLIFLSKKISYFLLPAILLITGLSLYFQITLDIKLDVNVLAAVIEANIEEFKFFINLQTITIIILISLISYLSVIFFANTKLHDEYHKSVFVCLVFTVCLIFLDGGRLKLIYPYNILDTSKQYISDKIFTPLILNDLSNYQYKIEKNSNNINIVFVIGESARSDHFSINGYSRLTNPNLKQIKNIVNYEKVTSCNVWTILAVPCLLTRNPNENSVLAVFKSLGFNTLWLGTQGSYSNIDSTFTRYLKDGNQAIIDGEIYGQHDQVLLTLLEQILSKNQDRKNMIVLHTLGSHFHYEDRYPREFMKFQPICKKKPLTTSMNHCTQEEIINSYDNSILYTDYILSRVIKILEHKNAMMIYISDHGESLGENGRYFHGNINAPEQKSVPLIFWFSNQYIKHFPQKYRALRSNRFKKTDYRYIFHSLLNCSGINSEIIDNKYNLCNNAL